MSIFPKRTVPGRFVTIHWNFNISNSSNNILFPLVKISVKDPYGKVDRLFDAHVAALPTREEGKSEDIVVGDQLQKHTPILVLAEYLSGKHKRERLVEILRGIKTGRHYYFSYPIKEDAPLGKYSIISEIHLDGQVIYSKTADEDFFYVEKVIIEKIETSENGLMVEVYNPSTEGIPVKLVEAVVYAEMTIKSRIIDLPPKQMIKFETSSKKAFIFYNEEREVIPLASKEPVQLIRNQKLLSVHKVENGEESVFVFEKEEEDAYKLEDNYRDIWNKANGISDFDNVAANELVEMRDSVLIEELRLSAQVAKNELS